VRESCLVQKWERALAHLLFFFFLGGHNMTSSVEENIALCGAMVLLLALYVLALLECGHATRPFTRIEVKVQSCVFASFDKEPGVMQVSLFTIKLAPLAIRNTIFQADRFVVSGCSASAPPHRHCSNECNGHMQK
jgi:hypothetical protein